MSACRQAPRHALQSSESPLHLQQKRPPHDLRVSHLYAASAHAARVPQALRRGAAQAREILQARRHVDDRDRPAQSGHPRLGLRQRARARQDPRRGGQVRRLAAGDIRVHPGHEVGDHGAAALFAAADALQPRPRSSRCAAIRSRPAARRRWPRAGASTCPAASRCRR